MEEAVMKHPLLIVVLATVVGSLGSNAFASDDNESRARARLDGYQENPSISTTGRGRLDLRIDEDAEIIRYELSYSRLEGTATASHIHFARERVNGPVSVFLCGGGGKPLCPTEGTVNGVITAADVATGAGAVANGLDTFAELLRAIAAHATYVNVHSTRWPGGEIRGQIRGDNRDDD
jgi:CHRD domain